MRKKLSPEDCTKISERMKIRCQDEEYRKQLAEKSKKCWQDEEFRKRMSEKHKANWQNDEYRKNVSSGIVAAWQDEEVKKHHADGMKNSDAVARGYASRKGRPLPERTKRKISETLRGRTFSDEHRRNLNESLRRASARPDVKQKRSAGSRASYEHPERRRNISESVKRLWKDESFRQRQCEGVRRSWDDDEMRKRHIVACSKAFSRAGWNGSRPERLIRDELDKLGIAYLANQPFERGMPDLRFPDAMLIVELDGSYWHGSDDAKAKDARMTSIYESAGYTVIRICSEDVAENPERFARMIAEELSVKQRNEAVVDAKPTA